MELNTICNNCKYNEGREEYDNNKFGIFCSNPKILDYVDTILPNCNLKEIEKQNNENKTSNSGQA